MLSLDHHHHCRQQQRYDKQLTGPKRRLTGCRLGLKYFFLVCFIYLYIFDLFTIRLRVSTGTTTATTEVWMGGEEKKGPKRRQTRRLGPDRYVFYFLFFIFLLLRSPRRPTAANNGQRRPTKANEGQRRPTKAHSSQQRPTTANKGQRRPTKAHSRQRRPTKANAGPRRPKRAQTTRLASFGPFRRYVTTSAGCTTPATPLIGPDEAHESPRRPTAAKKANAGPQRGKRAQTTRLASFGP